MTLKLGPPGYLHHWSSEKLVHPRGGAFVPDNNTELTVHSDKTNPDRLQFRFVSKEGAGYYGYIEHVSSGKFVHPRGNVFSSFECFTASACSSSYMFGWWEIVAMHLYSSLEFCGCSHLNT